MLAPWKKSYDWPREHIKNQRHYFANKGPSSQSNGFSRSHVWMWELDHKKTEHQRIDAFELWCWKRLLIVHWTARRSNQSIVKEISPEYSLEGLMLKLNLQCFGYLMQRTDSLEKTLMLGKNEGRRRREWQRIRLDGITDHEFEQAPRVGNRQGSLVCCRPSGRKESDTTEQLNWTDLT